MSNEHEPLNEIIGKRVSSVEHYKNHYGSVSGVTILFDDGSEVRLSSRGTEDARLSNSLRWLEIE